jgi:serine/threonine protein phosphatase PrpC
MTGTITVHALTHTGAVRASNEDAIAVGDWVCAQDLTKPKPFSFSLDAPHAAFIADGMGGHPGGDVASQAAVRFCVERAHAIADSYDGEQLLSDVNRHLYDMMVRGDGPLGMGTTLAGVLVRPDTVIVLNVGDSKVYRMEARASLRSSATTTPRARSWPTGARRRRPRRC